MKRVFYVHVFTASTVSLRILQKNGYEVVCVSLPGFVESDSHVRSTYSKEGIDIINIDAMNEVVIEEASGMDRNIPDRYIWQLLLQSQRLERYHSTSIIDRVVVIRDIYAGCVELLKRRDIDILLLGGLPHSLADCILLIAASELGVMTRIFQDFPAYPGGCVAYDKDLNPLRYIQPGRGAMQRSYYRFLLETMLDIQNNLETTKAMRFFQPDLDKGEKWAGVYASSSNVKSDIDNEDGHDYRPLWKSLSATTKYTKYIGVFLHAEPEAFTNPAFPLRLYPQIESIIRLREVVDQDIQLIVREHPAMFDAYPREASRYLDEQRSAQFIKRLERLQGVAFCDPDLDTYRFISSSEAVFCACGSASIETLLLRKPLIGIPFNPLSNHCGFIRLEEVAKDKIIHAVKMLNSMEDKILAESLIRYAMPGSPNGRYNMFYRPDEEKNSLMFTETVMMTLK